MKYNADIEIENTLVSLSDESHTEFFRAEVTQDGEIQGVHVFDHEGDDLIIDHNFDTYAEFEEWCDKTIERIQAMKKEVAKLVPVKVEKKPKPKKKAKK
ncbi:MAG TPA: hypothetical protein PL173_07650 [Saprospiraceae bacterium]|nr:hypothetical protein [Saprospiraceae bacterium]